MKKLALLLVAGSIIGFASCGNNENNTTKEQIDSTANARTDTMAAKLKMQNDSLINAMAKMRADSAMQANGGGAASKPVANAPTQTKVKTHTTTTTHTTKTTEINPSNNPGTTKPTITKDQQEQQNNKFNER